MSIEDVWLYIETLNQYRRTKSMDGVCICVVTG